MGAPLNYFLHSYGPAARPTMILNWVLVAVVLTVLIVVGLLLLGALVRKRRAADFHQLEHAGHGLRWIYLGTGISTCILFALVIYTLTTLNTIARPPSAPALTLTVTGYDWWWKVAYDDAEPARRFVTANEIHIPVGVPVLLKLQSADVIHAFWVPLLAGKTQMIPGLVNQQWLQADKPGIYRGQCTQYCGVQHAHMALEIVAQDAADFARWQQAQRQPWKAQDSTSAAQMAGLKLFNERCAGCHTVRGSEASGDHAPDLTHLNSRRLLAAGMLSNTLQHQIDWITHAQQLKPGSRMPSIALSPQQVIDLSAFLDTLD